MIAENLYHANLKISNEGHVTIESSWQLALSEKAESGGQLLNEARAWAGAVGDPLRIPLPDGSFEFSEQLFVTAIEFKAVGANSCQVVYSGIDRKVADFQLSIPIRDVDTDGFETCSVVWYVSCEQYDTFVASHPIGGEELWAGANFLLISIESKPFGKVGYELTLFARKVETRCISKVRSEKFVGVTRGGAIRREIIWNARYRVAATEIATFFGQTGTFPAEWPELNCMVTSVKPKQLTDMEYEVDLEVQHRNNPDLLVRYSREDRSDLSHRVDISVDMADFHVTAEMAGYQKQPSGQYMPIPNWENFVACPFICSDKLPNNMIDQTLRCLVITSSRYFSGDAMSRIDELVNWVNTRVTNSYVEGIDGSFLRIRQTCQEVFDDSGELYTRITRSYQKAPREYVWNTNYWASH